MSKAFLPSSLQEWRDCYCAAPPTLNTFRSGFTSLLRYFFSNSNNFAENKEILGCMEYSDDPKESKLKIIAQGASDPANTQNIPGIFISLGEGVDFNFDVLNNQYVSSRDFARETYVTLGTVNLIVKCSDKDADVSCAMADACLLFLTAIRKHLMSSWGWLKQYKIVKQTEPKLQQISEESATKWYDSSLVIQIVYQYSIDIDIESKRLKDFSSNSYIK